MHSIVRYAAAKAKKTKHSEGGIRIRRLIEYVSAVSIERKKTAQFIYKRRKRKGRVYGYIERTDRHTGQARLMIQLEVREKPGQKTAKS